MAIQDSHLRLESRLKAAGALLLDGAMGTELLRRGVDVSLPLWSAAALKAEPDVVLAIHKDYVQAGADIIITNTFRTTPRTFLKVTKDGGSATTQARSATVEAVRLAREAAGADVLVAGSIAPLEDCYSPKLFPGRSRAVAEFREFGEWLAQAGVDLLLLETMGRIDEAESALQATEHIACPRWVSFILKDVNHTLAGDDLSTALRMCVESGADAILVNCSNLFTSVRALEYLLSQSDLPVGTYPNLGKSMPTATGKIHEMYAMDEFAEQMARAIETGAKMIGGCCGSSPGHIRRLRDLIDAL